MTDPKPYAADLEELKKTIEALCRIRDDAFVRYSALVDAVLQDEITDKSQLEQIMDWLLDFCDEIRFLDLYKKLCRHIYYRHPQLVGEHVAMYRVLFEDPEGDGEK